MAPKQQVMSAREFMDVHDDMPDGAFFALAEEMGITAEDFEAEFDA